jgi:hypothetical protein
MGCEIKCKDNSYPSMYDLFTDTVNSSDSTAPTCGLLVNDALEKVERSGCHQISGTLLAFG